ncbi:MAG: hypothetical protein JW913_02380 [Chitinispirillaceae bacterium]|nr:hypothetical protein [Chitinispirillaceae bacterium]
MIGEKWSSSLPALIAAGDFSAAALIPRSVRIVEVQPVNGAARRQVVVF